jgi:hypothetical protein
MLPVGVGWAVFFFDSRKPHETRLVKQTGDEQTPPPVICFEMCLVFADFFLVRDFAFG